MKEVPITLAGQTYTLILEPAEEGGFCVEVKGYPGCYTSGETEKEAVAMGKEAVDLWVGN